MDKPIITKIDNAALGKNTIITGIPLIAKIDIAALGDNTIITGIPGLKIRIVKLYFVAASSVTVILKDGKTALTGAMTFSTNIMNFNGDENPLDLTAGNAFIMTLGGNVQVSGFVLYLLG